MIKFPKILRFDTFYNELEYYYPNKKPELEFTGTVKLHGTNAGIECIGGNIKTQSRTRYLSFLSDNNGFHSFVMRYSDELKEILKSINSDNVVIYGEFAGRGIQKGVAIASLEPTLYVFQIWDIGKQRFMPPIFSSQEHIKSILDFKTYRITIDFNDYANALNGIDRLTKEVEEECPVAKELGAVGVGEGIVWHTYHHKDLFFKSVGVKHSEVGNVEKLKKEANPNTAVFVETVCTDNRMLKIASSFSKDIKNTGAFIKSVIYDCLEEEGSLMSNLVLNVKDVNKEISKKASSWFKEYINY